MLRALQALMFNCHHILNPPKSNGLRLLAFCLSLQALACTAERADVGASSYKASACAVRIDTSTEGRLELLAAERLNQLADSMPCVADGPLKELLESSDTIFYGQQGIVPGYQDSFGDGTQLPVGMRPNTIRNNLIDLAVPGGHAQVFESRGTFHFPFGRPTGARAGDTVVINFWHIPKDEEGRALPVVYYRRRPSNYTNRIDWVFPVGTVLGEMMFMVNANNEWLPFEIRTRERLIDDWHSNAYRPFTEAAAFAKELREQRMESESWFNDPSIQALIAHLENPETLRPATLGSTKFPSAFATVSGAEDVLPPVEDPALLESLLRETPFHSAEGAVWKSNQEYETYAPTTQSRGSIVPRGFNAGLIPVDQESCTRCHRDAGRPFKDYYSNIIAYGELWGQDETFTWHPFEAASFVRPDGSVVNFNNDNRRMRKDFEEAGVLAPYQESQHSSSVYGVIQRDWTGYTY
jgi:hypothetical protein